MSSEAVLQEWAASSGIPFQYVPAADSSNKNSGSEEKSGAPDTSVAEQLEMREKAAYERGLIDGEIRIRPNFEARASALQETIRKAIENFRVEREEYFSRIEPEVVQLALAIARKILHRESQIDPLLLTGLVHVALEKLEAGTRVRLKVNPADTHFWNEFFARSGGPITPEISGDPSLPHGECGLETEIGSTQISLETQLKEIEQGFFDLLDQRPKVR